MWRPVNYVVEYDASLRGEGLVLSKLDNDGLTKTFLKAVKIRFLFSLGDDSWFENSAEFIAVVIS